MSKIVIESLVFSNVMSYGDNVKISFNNHAVTQLVGANGVGKSTIATILEEVLYNKNSRGIKKEDLHAWNSAKKEYSIELRFSKGQDRYVLTKVVKSTAKVTLLQNGIDISGHTATQTYKLLEQDILCADFQTMTKLIYQSVGSSMDFLKTTDAARKTFLVGLLDLHVYSEISDKLKEEKKAISNRLNFLSGQEDVLQSTLRGCKDIPEYLESIPEQDNSELIKGLTDELYSVNNSLENRTKLVSLRDRYDRLLREFKAAEEPMLNRARVEFSHDEYLRVSSEYNKILTLSEDTKARYKKFKSDAENALCPTCGTKLDKSSSEKAMAELKTIFVEQAAQRDALKAELDVLSKDKVEHELYVRDRCKMEAALDAVKMFEESVDISSFAHLPDESFLLSSKEYLETQLRVANRDVEKVRKENQRIAASNAKREVLLEQRIQTESALESIMDELVELESGSAELDVAVLTMKDLISYKIEYSIKSFEGLINHYLGIMTSGEFALGFELEDTKLKVVIFKDGNKTSMENCSTGQQSRISIATLLAIRVMLSKLSKVEVNLLFLDEVVSFIDPKGLETLVELLIEEHELNSVIVSHGRTHPLAHKVSVEQDQFGKSYIEQ